MPEKTEVKQIRGRFKPGQSGNPAGRPKGSYNKATRAALELMEGQLEAITQTCIDAAIDGDMTAIRIVLDKLISPCKERTLSELELPQINSLADLPSASNAILKAASKGYLTPSEAACFTSLVASHGKTLEQVYLEARVAALEARNVS